MIIIVWKAFRVGYIFIEFATNIEKRLELYVNPYCIPKRQYFFNEHVFSFIPLFSLLNII